MYLSRVARAERMGNAPHPPLRRARGNAACRSPPGTVKNFVPSLLPAIDLRSRAPLAACFAGLEEPSEMTFDFWVFVEKSFRVLLRAPSNGPILHG